MAVTFRVQLTRSDQRVVRDKVYSHGNKQKSYKDESDKKWWLDNSGKMISISCKIQQIVSFVKCFVGKYEKELC